MTPSEFETGDFFEKPAAGPRVLSVTELTHEIRGVLEGNFGQVWVEGEVSNHRKQASGHQYFNLKDAKCQLPCVLFHRPYLRLRQAQLADGMLVHVRGELTVYEARGQYQLNVTLAQAAGVGLLQAKFEALKKKLAAEGLFDSARKKALPKFPHAIGIITSPSGAAIADIINILQRRAPWVRIVIHPVRVQGEGAAVEIAAAIDEFQLAGVLPEVEILVVCRGGGSAEDLWQFNEEVLARAIYRSAIPVVSAVGHEIDFTIADFVADLRAPTPSAAAELVVPDGEEVRGRLEQLSVQLRRNADARLAESRARVASAARGIRDPASRLDECWQRADLAVEALRRAAAFRFAALKQHILALRGAVERHRPDQVAQLRRQRLAEIVRHIDAGLRGGLEVRRTRLRHCEGLLRVLGPQATLERGFSVTTNAAGEVLRSVRDASPGTKILTRLQDGVLASKVSK